MINAYALPDGTIVSLPSHCRDAAERYTLTDRTLVWAVQIGLGTPEAAAHMAASLPPPRRPVAR